MKKRKILALMLAVIISVTSSTAFAAGYNVNHGKVSGGTMVTIGQLNSPTLFYGRTTWDSDKGRVAITATTYTTNLETGDIVEAQKGKSQDDRNCTIDQTHNNFTAGTYSIAKVNFKHEIYFSELSEYGTYQWEYSGEVEY